MFLQKTWLDLEYHALQSEVSSYLGWHSQQAEGSPSAMYLILPFQTSHKFAYADDMVITVKCKSCGVAEAILERDLEILGAYYRTWRLVPTPSKTERPSFH